MADPRDLDPPPPDETAFGDDDGEIGRAIAYNLRRLRVHRGYSLERLSGRSGVSRSMLSQIEQGKSVPSVALLWKIARGLAVPFDALIHRRPDVQAVVLRDHQTRRLTSADGSFVSRPLFPYGGRRTAEFYEMTIRAGTKEASEAHPEGTLENLVVAEGRLTVEIPDESFELGRGDALLFAGDVPHAYIAGRDEDARVFLVMVYPQEVLY